MLKRNAKSSRFRVAAVTAIVFVSVFYLIHGTLLRAIGGFLVVTEIPSHADAAVVLFTGPEFYGRMEEAAALFREGTVDRVAINGNRKSEVLRDFESRGFQPCCPWYEDYFRILEVLGVPRDRVIAISAEDAYDTVSEARLVGKVLSDAGIRSIVVTTSKFHTRRSQFIWKHMYPVQFKIYVAAARTDPFSINGWWKDGRQLRWVMAEYGAAPYDFWKLLKAGQI